MKFMSILGDLANTYCNPKICSKFFIGFSCGVPFLLTLTILDLWLKDCGLSNTVIGFFSLLHWPFILKFLWAPFIDRFNFPFLSKWLGKRRGWAVASQLLLFVGLLGMSFSNPETHFLQLIICASVVAFADGCQDMSLYAYQLDQAKGKMIGPVAGVVIFGYKIGMFFAKSTALYLAHYYSWSRAYAIMAFSVFVSIFFIFYIEEPQITKTRYDEQIENMLQTYKRHTHCAFELFYLIKSTIFECLICPFKIFMKRNNWRHILVLITLFRAGDIMFQKMAKPFYIDIGFSILEIANVVQVFGTVSALIGSILGGYFIKKCGIKSAMLYSSIAHALSCLAYVVMSLIGYNIHLLYFTVFVENITGGSMGASFIAFLYSLCDHRYCATQYALLWAFYDCGGSFCRIISGMLADALGWTYFFLCVFIMFIPGIIILCMQKSHKTSK